MRLRGLINYELRFCGFLASCLGGVVGGLALLFGFARRVVERLVLLALEVVCIGCVVVCGGHGLVF